MDGQTTLILVIKTAQEPLTIGLPARTNSKVGPRGEINEFWLVLFYLVQKLTHLRRVHTWTIQWASNWRSLSDGGLSIRDPLDGPGILYIQYYIYISLGIHIPSQVRYDWTRQWHCLMTVSPSSPSEARYLDPLGYIYVYIYIYVGRWVSMGVMAPGHSG